ncbi:MAG: hypothetical protein ONB05_06515 [candidate division KSB1 bacterium]|nr:hypothetical protein [candidate division KSB1 bacterium]
MQVRTEQQALEFINDVGFCFAFKAHQSELPCLWHAACGERHPVMPHHTHHDPYINLVWEAKDTLVSSRKIYYGKALKKRPTMISLEYFPYFYVLSGNGGESDTYRAQYLRGELSTAAKRIMDALLERSPQITRDLKLASGYSHPHQRYEFDQGMDELQMNMYILKIAEFYDPFTFLWELVPRRFPEEVKQAGHISLEEAREKILTKYFENLIVSNAVLIERLFGWGKATIERHLQTLVQKGVITSEVEVEGEKGTWFAIEGKKGS